MVNSVLFVCTGNTCRSPMAEYIARDFFEKNNLGIRVSSRGIYAVSGGKMSDNSMRALQSLGIKTDQFSSKLFVREDINDFDIILTMTRAHKEILLSSEFADERKIFSIYEFVYEKDSDISDPYGQNYGVYEACAFELRDIIKDLIIKLT